MSTLEFIITNIGAKIYLTKDPKGIYYRTPQATLYIVRLTKGGMALLYCEERNRTYSVAPRYVRLMPICDKECSIKEWCTNTLNCLNPDYA